MLRVSRTVLKISLGIVVFISLEKTIIAQEGGISVSVFPSFAPNVFGSPSFTPWENNAISALMSGSSSAGSASLPSYYNQIPNGANVPLWIVTDFPSWNAMANPGTVFGPAYAAEFGNRLYFNLHINGNGFSFNLTQLSFQATSTDAGNFLGYSIPAGSFNYSTSYVGLQYGPDGMKGGGDDVLITGGPNTQFVNELFARGTGNAPAVLSTDPGATDQDKIDNARLLIPSDFIFNGQYSLGVDDLGTFNGSAFVVVAVPEPATVAMTSLGGAALVFACVTQWKKRRRRKQRTLSKPSAAKA
ncbi:MAG TPA: hypothetical protein PLN21_17370 [Gemmatales bacterium]|nr:hypothetical protein [Gemmatales bacterium]